MRANSRGKQDERILSVFGVHTRGRQTRGAGKILGPDLLDVRLRYTLAHCLQNTANPNRLLH